jgi:hypothetical protein
MPRVTMREPSLAVESMLLAEIDLPIVKIAGSKVGERAAAGRYFTTK